ncbi:NUDIX domain-containing protein [candidate division KSB1 bacterium]|nr:NUDIX domain-containing protein [candidate division KSB1 bacterium]
MREPIPTWFFVLVVVRLGRRFLVVRESKYGQRWYLPAGRVEPGETFFKAAEREALEEAGIPIEVERIVRIEHTPADMGTARVRIILVARPKDDSPLKKDGDDESLEAAWVTLEEFNKMPVRNEEVRELFNYVASGKTALYPKKLISEEGRPFE